MSEDEDKLSWNYRIPREGFISNAPNVHETRTIETALEISDYYWVRADWEFFKAWPDIFILKPSPFGPSIDVLPGIRIFNSLTNGSKLVIKFKDLPNNHE